MPISIFLSLRALEVVALIFFSPLNYNPEKILSYEVGAKATLLDNRLYLEAALYHSDYTDYQASSQSIQGNITSNPGEAEIQGIEWSTLWTLSDYFSLGFNGNYTESEYTKINPSATQYQVGDPLNLVPKYNYSLSANFDFEWSYAAQGFVNIDYSRQDGQSDTNRSAGFLYMVSESEDIGLLNAQIGAQFESISLKLFGKNLTNELKNRMPNGAHNNRTLQHRPRTIGLELNYQF
ncbi:TonB-dependent receptor [Porticoccaceae bacterium]|nr:TonB-dependent receptor [Porticoccaceae bacterium]